MQSIYFSTQHEKFRQRVRAFIEREITPHAAAWEADRALPGEAFQAFAREGLLGLAHAQSHGGQAQDFFHSVVLLEELGRTGFAGLRASISVHAYMATHYLARHAAPMLQENMLIPAIRGEKIAALAITEPEAGSDLSRLGMTARLEGDRYVVDGIKTCITNGAIANYFVAAVRTGEGGTGMAGNAGISLLLIEADREGVSVRPQEKLGWHSAATAEIRLESVCVPQSNLIGRTNSGFMYLMKGFQLERVVASALAIGGIEATLDTALDYLCGRQAFNGRLADLQAIRHRLADLATELSGARMLTYHAAWAYARDELSIKECSMAKLKTTELACQAADACLQLQGARGYLAESDISRIYRDARAGAIAGGASDVMREIVAQQVFEGRAIQAGAKSAPG